MPQWRKIHTKINQSDDFNDMPDDFTRLTWIMLSTYADSEGRYVDNVNLVRSTLYPMREDVTNQMVSDALQWFEDRNMITRYSSGGRNYFYIPTFKVYQDTTKSAASTIPEPTPDLLQSNSRVTPDLLQTNSRPTLEQKRREEKRLKRDGEVEEIEKPTAAAFSRIESASLKNEFDELPEEAKLLELYSEITGLTYIASDMQKDAFGWMRQIKSMYSSEERMKADMIAQFKKWQSTKGKTGKFYSPTGIGWLQWVIDGRE